MDPTDLDPMTLDPSVPELIDTWESALVALADLAEPLDVDQWNAPTPCPGWSVADVVAHTADIEWIFSGDPRPEHTPDWAALPHATGPFAAFTETGVDYRRGWPKGAVLDELRARTLSRRAQLDTLPVDAEVPGFSGGLVPLSRFVRTRTLDIWAHEQDIRSAIDEPGAWGSGPAIVSFQQMAAALPYVWGKSVAAPPEAVVHITVIGPELAAELWARVDANGKGRADGPAGHADLHLTLPWPDYMRLSCGRIDVHDAGLRERIDLAGDGVLGEALLPALAITP